MDMVDVLDIRNSFEKMFGDFVGVGVVRCVFE